MDDLERSLSREEIAKIAAEFKQSVATLKDLPVPIDNDTSGIPIFTEESIKNPDNNILDIALRTLFVKYRITRLMFTRQFNRYAVSLLHIPELMVNAQRENHLRAIKNGSITLQMFTKVLLAVLGMRIGLMTLELLKFDGGKVTVTIDTSDCSRYKPPEALANQNPFNSSDDSKEEKK